MILCSVYIDRDWGPVLIIFVWGQGIYTSHCTVTLYKINFHHMHLF